MQREETVGITTDVYRGRGGANLYRSISYRTAGGCCVQNREMEDGGIKHYNMHEYAEMFRNVP